MPNFQKIGEFAVEKAQEYQRSIEVHSELVKQRNELDNKIREAELAGDKKLLEELYKEFRILKTDQMANLSYRQKFCDDFLFEIGEMARETNNEE